jgi:hypothetical protein
VWSSSQGSVCESDKWAGEKTRIIARKKICVTEICARNKGIQKRKKKPTIKVRGHSKENSN